MQLKNDNLLFIIGKFTTKYFSRVINNNENIEKMNEKLIKIPQKLQNVLFFQSSAKLIYSSEYSISLTDKIII